MDPFQNNAVFSPSPNTGDIILSPSAPAKKSKKPLVIVLIILILLAAGAAAWYFLRPGNNTETTETLTKYSATENLKDAYSALLESYEMGIGYDASNLSINTQTWIFPATKDGLESFTQLINESNTAIINYSKYDNQSDFLTKIKNTTSAISNNIKLISNFYNAFVLPIQNTGDESQIKTLSSAASKEMMSLIESEDQNISVAASSYYDLYTYLVEGYKAGTIDNIKVEEKATAALTSLKACLAVVEQDTESITQINAILEAGE